MKPKKRFFEQWIPPGLEAFKFNVDGSVRGQLGQAGIGGVLRDSRGLVLCLFSISVGCQEVITAELIAIDKACTICISNQRLLERSIEIASDSLMAVSWINSDSFGSMAHVKIIYYIREKLSNHGSLEVRYYSRISNSVADNLAKRASKGDEEDFIQWSSS